MEGWLRRLVIPGYCLLAGMTGEFAFLCACGSNILSMLIFLLFFVPVVVLHGLVCLVPGLIAIQRVSGPTLAHTAGIFLAMVVEGLVFLMLPNNGPRC